ncbi:MAG: methyltransferase domain-containing protein [Polyangiaceae bacterium]|nr:methyltransferase domain-containing protein [Polyangiaceae bacterium]
MPSPRPALCYAFDRSRLPARWAAHLASSEPNAALDEYVARATDRRLGWFGTALHRLLRLYFSEYDVNAWLGAYPMHLGSPAEWSRLLETDPGAATKRGRLLDIGAGDGTVTLGLVPLFDAVETTELSPAMARRLEHRGYPCHRCDVAGSGLPPGPWDAISLLNVLDRTSRPMTLLRRAVAGLASDGILIVALPLPYEPASYCGPYLVEPEERLPIPDGDWETQATSLVERALEPLGCSLTALSRWPYLAGGDARTPLSVFDDLVVVVRRVEGG